MFNLFLIFFKINLLSPSGPTSVGLTEKLVVPNLITHEKFSEILAISSGMPGSDAVQMAWQIGYATKGITGAFISVLGALIPCILMVVLAMIGLSFFSPKILAKFFDGVKPALAIFLVMTAFGMFPHTGMVMKSVIIAIIVIPMFYFKLPILLILVLSGLIGLFL